MTVRSVAEPVGTGTRQRVPVEPSLELGQHQTDRNGRARWKWATTLIARARGPTKVAGADRPCKFWSGVYAWTVVMSPRSEFRNTFVKHHRHSAPGQFEMRHTARRFETTVWVPS